MRIPIKIHQLRIGMHVVLPGSWFSHGFVRNSFLIRTKEQLEKIKKSGFLEVLLDTEKSNPAEEEKKDPTIENNPLPALIDAELLDAIHDDKIPVMERSRLVNRFCEKVAIGVFENPSRETIQEARKGFHHIVDIILHEEAILDHLIRITSHDHYTYTHSVNVGFYAIALVKSMYGRSDAHDLEELGAAFFLHDLGKVMIDQGIINKPARLTDEEMNEMRRHPGHGFKLLQEAKQLSEEGRIIVLQHHERFNGSGYPRKLKGDEIHIYGKICSIADVYDALTSKRPYRNPLNPFEALKLMRDEMINHFQEDLFEKFVLLFI